MKIKDIPTPFALLGLANAAQKNTAIILIIG
jgi:hypothetical protein